MNVDSNEPATPLAPIEKLIEEIRRGRLVILVDSPHRENEGDLVMAAECATSEAIGFMARLGRGLVCVPLAPHVADRLALPPMVDDSSEADPSACAFTISVDAREGITTGISAQDRAITARLLANPATRPRDLKRPGHLFPLRARPRGVLERSGHTEAAVDLARLAGFGGAGVICEIMNDDGTMARMPDLVRLARRESLLVGSIEDLIAYRRRHEIETGLPPDAAPLRHLSNALLPTAAGVFEIDVFANERSDEIVALSMGKLREQPPSSNETVLVRVHSACFTGDVLGSLRCDCGQQLENALQAIAVHGRGLVVYLPQEGRGIGLAKKVAAYKLQQLGLDTVEANLRLGFPADLRTYEDAAAVLRWFNIQRVRLLTNNPAKVEGLRKYGLEVAERLPLETGRSPANYEYLQTKKHKLGHWLSGQNECQTFD
ncbi:MAG: 3,4-dihydroxy-2-butanone-4-phosphate synthase [Planctomycetota bacterium]